MTEIKRATRIDLDALLPLVGAYRTFYDQAPDLRREREFLRRQLEDGTSTIYLARDGREEAVGFVQIFQVYSTVRLGLSLILEDLFVVPSARRMGVATRLLQRALEFARDVGAMEMFLETAKDNIAARDAYERAGWTREGRFLKYNAPPLDEDIDKC
jgi:GNAT superfamily N-acetyltransferase